MKEMRKIGPIGSVRIVPYGPQKAVRTVDEGNDIEKLMQSP